MKSKELFEKYKQGKHWEKHPTIYAERFAEFLKKQNFKGIIVDIGCGNGRDTNVFSSLGFNALGIDYSDTEIKLAKQNFPNCNFEVQNAEKLELQDESTDALFIINVIHYLNAKKSIKEFHRILKPESFIFIHFNLEIKDDKTSKFDYSTKEEEIYDLIRNFKIKNKNIFKRTDNTPRKHTHKIMELILQKK